MWVVIYGRHWVYLKYKEYRYETPKWYLAVAVYLYYHFRYSLSIYPVKYVKMYKTGDVIKLKHYTASFMGRKNDHSTNARRQKAGPRKY
jgi:hypothetical protein